VKLQVKYEVKVGCVPLFTSSLSRNHTVCCHLPPHPIDPDIVAHLVWALQIQRKNCCSDARSGAVLIWLLPPNVHHDFKIATCFCVPNRVPVS
jgi:hypothetical protein